MRKWLLIGGAGAVVGYVGVYFALGSKPAAEPQPEPVPAVATPAAPVVLTEVVEVTDLDPLLEPRSTEPPGVPFDSPAAPDAKPVAAPIPIPAATD